MDFNNETELDYEEDDLEDDCKKTSSEKKCQAEDKDNEVNEDSNVSGVDDQYLQIDFTEEDENFTWGEEPLKTESCENQNAGKAKERIEAGEKIEESKVQVFSRNERFRQSNNNEHVNNSNDDDNTNNNYDNNGGTVNVKKSTGFAPRLRQWEFKTPVTPVGYNWMNNSRTFTHDNQTPDLIQNFYPNQNSAFTLLNWITNRQQQNWQHLRNLNKSFPNYLQIPFVSPGSRFPIGNRKIFSGNVRYKKVEPHLQNAINSKRSTLDKNLNNSSRSNRKSRFDDFSDRKANSTDNEHLWLSKVGIKNDEEKNGSDAPCYFLNEDEKKLIELKKEARLKRFVQEDLIIREKKSLVKKEISSSFKDQPTAEQKLFLKEGGTQIDVPISDDGRGGLRKEKLEINKESLLKKRNPFEASVYNSCAKIKCLEYKSVIPFTVEEDLEVKKIKEGNAFTVTDSIGRGISVNENDTDSGVKFLRTVSKSFDELVHKTRPESQPSEVVKTLPFTQSDNTSCQNEDVASVESQLTGCIVKVLNVPPSITTSDVLGLCNPIGKVLEVKLNIPKENSAVIRFAESEYAEKFFSIYHGQKMSDYFLNVIVV